MSNINRNIFPIILSLLPTKVSTPHETAFSRFHDGLILFQFDSIGTKFGTFGT